VLPTRFGSRRFYAGCSLRRSVRSLRGISSASRRTACL
jgi:hypothetical protein